MTKLGDIFARMTSKDHGLLEILRHPHRQKTAFEHVVFINTSPTFALFSWLNGHTQDVYSDIYQAGRGWSITFKDPRDAVLFKLTFSESLVNIKTQG